jgi:hypothetical protein
MARCAQPGTKCQAPPIILAAQDQEKTSVEPKTGAKNPGVMWTHRAARQPQRPCLMAPQMLPIIATQHAGPQVRFTIRQTKGTTGSTKAPITAHANTKGRLCRRACSAAIPPPARASTRVTPRLRSSARLAPRGTQPRAHRGKATARTTPYGVHIRKIGARFLGATLTALAPQRSLHRSSKAPPPTLPTTAMTPA